MTDSASDRSDLQMLDASTLEPVATIQLPAVLALWAGRRRWRPQQHFLAGTIDAGRA